MNEIARTAFHYLKKQEWSGPYPPGHVFSNIDKNKICPYCKNQDTEIIHDAVSLAPFKEFYGENRFKVVHCVLCEAVFSYKDIE